VLTVAYLVAATVTGRMETVALAVGSAAAWAFIWSWRASASRVVGGNLWMAGLVIVVAPAAVASVLLVRAGLLAHAAARTRLGRDSGEL
jgi:CBS-domain-containing membrane protein